MLKGPHDPRVPPIVKFSQESESARLTKIILFKSTVKTLYKSLVAKITFVVAEITFKVAVITFSVAKITFVVAEITLIASSVVKITFEKCFLRM